MATMGFESAIFNVEQTGGTFKELVVDKSGGGAINAKITGLGVTINTIHASNVPFFSAAKGVSAPKVTIEVADLLDNGVYQTVVGAETVDGAMAIGANTAPPYTSVVLVTGTKENTRLFMGMTKGKFSHPDIEAKTGEDKGVELQTDTLEGDFVADSRGWVYFAALETEEMTLQKFKNIVNGKEIVPKV